jgi:hypothetical protein
MIKNKINNRSRVEDVGVINKGGENTREKNARTTQNTKMGKSEKGF